MGLMDFVRNLFGRGPVYDPERAVVVAFHHLSPEMKASLEHGDVENILNFEFRYLDERGVTGDGPGSDDEPQTIEHETLVAYIRQKAEQRLLQYSEQQIEAVLAAEMEYMRKVGIIEDVG